MLLVCLFITGTAAAQVEFCGEPLPLSQEQVQRTLLATLKKNRGELGRGVKERAALYLPFIQATIAAYGLPQDLQFIPFVESRFRRGVPSSAGALGIWQLMPATAGGLGLKVGATTDERNLVVKSTHAACRLLLQLYQEFGSWTLAAAAYNYGSGNIRKSIRRQGHTDYYALRLNDETAAYLYELVSFKILYSLHTSGQLADYYRREESPAAAGRKLPEKDSTVFLQIKPLAGGQGRKKKGWGGAETTMMPVSDTITVRASVVTATDIIRAGGLAVVTADSHRLAGELIPKNTLVKSVLFPRTDGRVPGEAAGIDVRPALKEYNIIICDSDGQAGLAAAGKKTVLPGGYRVFLKFCK